MRMPATSDTGTNSTGGTKSSSRPAANPANSQEDGIEYTVQTGDNHLGVIVKRYNDEKIPVTAKAIMNANPSVKLSKPALLAAYQT